MMRMEQKRDAPMHENMSIIREMQEYEKNDFSRSTDQLIPPTNTTQQIKIASDFTNIIPPQKTTTKQTTFELSTYQKLFQNLLEGILIVNEQGLILFANPSAAALFGFPTIDAMIGKQFTNYLDSKHIETITTDQHRIRLGEGGFIDSYEARTNDDKRIFIEGIGCSITYEQQPSTALFLRDITQTKKTIDELSKLEKKYQAIAEMSSEGVIIIDPLGTLTYSNPAFHGLIHETAQTIQGRPLRDFFSHDSIYLFQEVFMTARKHRKRAEHIDLELINKDGQSIPVECSFIPFIEHDTFTGCICTIHDISERKKVEEEIKRSEQLKTEFMNIAAHELKSPVTPIKGYLDLIISDPNTPTQVKKWAKVSLRNADRLLLLVNDILDVSRLDNDTMKFDMRKLDATMFLQDVTEDMRLAIEAKNLQYTIDIPKTEAYILGDQNRLDQVIRNLLVNAIKFTDQGEITVKAQIKNQKLLIDVTDTGIGIPPHDQKNIFKKFYQSETCDSRKYEGTGLGLFISKEILKKHHGDLTVKSTPGHGSTFTIQIPLLS